MADLALQKTRFTEQAFRSECDYLKGAAKEKSMLKPFKVGLVGRVFLVPLICLLHADVISGLARICFYWAREMLWDSKPYPLKNEIQKWLTSCRNFSLALKGLWNLEVLINYTDPNRRTSIDVHVSPRNSRAPSPIPFSPNKLPPTIPQSPPQSPTDARRKLFDDVYFNPPGSPPAEETYLRVTPPRSDRSTASSPIIISPRSPLAAPYTMVEDEAAGACQTPQRKSPLPRLKLPEEQYGSSSVDIETTPIDPLPPLDLSLDDYDGVDASSEFSIEELLNGAGADEEPEANSKPSASPRQLKTLHSLDEVDQKEGDPAPTLKPRRPSLTFDPHEQYLKDVSRGRAQRRAAALQAEREPVSAEIAFKRLQTDFRDAQTHLHENDSPLVLEKGEEHHYQDPLFSSDTCEVRFCQYVPNPNGPTTHPIMQTFQVKMGETLQDGTVFGIVDPQLGQRAAQFFTKNLVPVLQRNLSKHNPLLPSTEGIYNGIALTFVELDDAFYSTIKAELAESILADEEFPNQKTSATLGIILNNVLWVVHVGTGGAVLNSGTPPKLMTEVSDPKSLKYKARAEALGAVVENGRINDTSDPATGFGFQGFNKGVSALPMITACELDSIGEGESIFIGTEGFFSLTSSKRINALLKANKDKLSFLIHDLVITAKTQQPQKRHACMIVQFTDWTNI